jgi:MFS transporter, DHA3 family, macrolide efflux protein
MKNQPMRIFKVLARRQIRLLWAGQVFSGVGDEIYNIALVWFAADLIGLNAGYIASIQAASIFALSLVGGVWADHRDNARIMITADLVRGFAVLVLPLSTAFAPLGLSLLIPIAIIVSSLSALFNPALKAFLPEIIDDRKVLETTNGLMETTNRFARVIGPGFIGLVGPFLPVIHYFTMDAISFFASAWSISMVHKEGKGAPSVYDKSGLFESLKASQRLARQDNMMSYLFFTGSIAGAAWMFIFPLGITLYLREHIHSDVGTLGKVIFGYGLGNITSTLILSNFSIARPGRWYFVGEIFGGVGFVLFAHSQTLHQAMAACALAAAGGPMADLGLVNLFQRRFRGRDLVRVHRFNMALSYGYLLLGFLISPSLFRSFSVANVVLGSACLIGLPGIIGLICFGAKEKIN